MVYGSICSGIEAATAAWHQLGWKPSFFSEIDKFPRAVLAHHYPNVPLHGDFTTIQQGQYAAIDVLVGGTPCQSFSVSGLRGGMDDHRGNLTLEFGKIAGRLRPAWLVWENVPGVLSSKRGGDFASFLGLLAGKSITPPAKGRWLNSGVVQGIDDAYSVAWRVLDAQHFGVPQRRRRVFLVGCLGADWRRAAAVLFERHSMSGDPPPRKKKGQGAATCFETGPGGYHSSQVSPTIDTRVKNGPVQNQVGLAIVGHGEYDASLLPLLRATGGDCGGGSEGLIVMSTGQGGASINGDLRTTLTCNHEAPIIVKTSDTGSNGDNYSLDGVAYTLDTSNGQAIVEGVCAGFKGGNGPKANTIGYQEEVSPTLTSAESGTNMVPCVLQPVAFYQNQRNELIETDDRTNCLASNEGMKQRTYLASSVDEECNANEELHGPLLKGGQGGTRQTIVQIPAPENFQSSQSGVRTSPVMGTLDANYGGRRHNGVLEGLYVRRLTPLEASRLQGFPDDFARIPWNGKPAESCPDGPQYKAYGNSMAVPVMAWIGRRLQMVHELIEAGRI